MNLKVFFSNSVVSAYLKEQYFTKVPGQFAWVRRLCDISHIVLFEATKGGNLRIRLFVLSKKSQYSLGGNLTQSSIGGGNTVGSDYVWEISSLEAIEKSSIDIINTIKNVAIPWLSVFVNEEGFANVLSAYDSKSQYVAPSEFLDLDFPIVNICNVKSDLKISSAQDFINSHFILIKEYLNEELFIQNLDDPFVFTRKRGHIFDVIMVELINNGMHFGAYAFSWVEDLAIDGSGMFNKDNALMLNGGVVSDSGVGVDSGEAFLLGSVKNGKKSVARFVSLLDEETLPYLSSIVSKSDFLRSVKPEMSVIASSFIKSN